MKRPIFSSAGLKSSSRRSAAHQCIVNLKHSHVITRTVAQYVQQAKDGHCRPCCMRYVKTQIAV